MDSVKYAVIGISKQIGFNEDETANFFETVVKGPEDAEIFRVISDKMQGFTGEQVLDVLATILDGWVVNNADEKTFNKKVDRQQLRQYAPLELIGWNEVKSDLLFLNPILSSVGFKIDEETLSQTYHTRVANYMEKMQINGQDDLTSLIQQGRNYYSILPKELDDRLLIMSDTVSSQIIQNWKTKDQQSAQIISARQQQTSNNEVKM